MSRFLLQIKSESESRNQIPLIDGIRRREKKLFISPLMASKPRLFCVGLFEVFEQPEKKRTTKLLREISFASHFTNIPTWSSMLETIQQLEASGGPNMKPDPRRLSTHMAGQDKKHPQYPWGTPSSSTFVSLRHSLIRCV